jgi:hypothetical protein
MEAWMSNSERWAWWTLGVMALTAVAYGVLLAIAGHGPVVISAFSVLALTAVPASSRRKFHGREFDERERAIANMALRMGFSALWIVLTAGAIGVGAVKGYETVLSVPAWMLVECLLWAIILMWTVQAGATILGYRGTLYA